MPVYYTVSEGKIYERWECPFCDEIVAIVSVPTKPATSPRIEDLAMEHFEVHSGDLNRGDICKTMRDFYNNQIEDTETTMDEWITKCVMSKL